MTLDPLWLRVYRDVGGDRYVSPAELPAELAPARALWETYDRQFGRFTGAALDPLFCRFAHGDLKLATPILPADVPVLIVGTGPSLDAHCDDLRRLRTRVIVASSPRGAFALQARGLFADLVLVEHQSAFDAEISADAARHDGLPPLHPESAILADAATPPDLLRPLDPARVRLAHMLPTWGLWPATLAALALDAGAPMVGLLGVDLGSDGVIDPPHRPLLSVLELLGHAAHVCRDCGHAGPPKSGWPRISLAAFAGTSSGLSRGVSWRDEQSPTVIFDRAAEDLAALQPLLPDARAALAVGLQARAGHPPSIRELTQAVDLMLAWGADPRLRWMLQRGLGLSFLPRFWRTGVSVAEPRQLWRSIVLSLHELTAQADRLEARLRLSHRRGMTMSNAYRAPQSGAARAAGRGLAAAASTCAGGGPAAAGASTAGGMTPGFAETHGASSAAGVGTGAAVGMGARAGAGAGAGRAAASAASESSWNRALDGTSDAASSTHATDPAAMRAMPAMTSAMARSMAVPLGAPIEPRRVRTEPIVHATRISVLLPVRNGLPWLHDAVASLAAQTHPDLEILVIDDGSDDGGPQEILAQALSHVRVIRSAGHGMAAALNTGLRAATGAFIARQQADDWSHPERLARQFEYLLRHPEVDVLATSVEIVAPDGRRLDEAGAAAALFPCDAAQTDDLLARRFSDLNAIVAGTMLARRERLQAAAGYRLEASGTPDLELWQRLLPTTRFAKLPTRLYTARLRNRDTGGTETAAGGRRAESLRSSAAAID